jgi:uncharacterized protein RhaS with RHS repeats
VIFSLGALITAIGETGIYCNCFRYYDPQTTQYLTPEPIGLDAGLRSWGYVENPATWIDPLGLARCPKPGKGLIYVANPKHGRSQRGRANPESTNPQESLENSIEISETTTRRIVVDKDTNEFVVFDEHRPGVFHGHSRSWGELDQTMQSAFHKNDLANKKGELIK